VVLLSVAIPEQENGADDAFAAGMLSGIHEGWSVEQSLRLAHATAAASLRSCLALADKWGSRDH